MITFEEFLKGVSNNPIIEEEQEFLEEAYSPEMKKVFTSSQLGEVGSFLAKQEKISVQDSDFKPLPAKWKLTDLKNYKYCIFKDNSGNIIVSERNYGTGRHYCIYPPVVSHKDIDASVKKSIALAFGLVENLDSTIRDKQYDRRQSRNFTDKLTDVNNRVKALSPTSTVGKLKALCKKYNSDLYGAAIDHGQPYVSIVVGGITNEVVCIHLEYTKGAWKMRINTPSYYNLTPKHIMNAKETFDNALKLYDEVKDFDLSDLPTD